MSRVPFTFILYVGDNPASQIATRLVPRHVRIAVQNVDTLQDRPAWLDGTPFLVRPSDDKQWRGTEAIATLSDYMKWLSTHVALDFSPIVEVPKTVPFYPLHNPVVDDSVNRPTVIPSSELPSVGPSVGSPVVQQPPVVQTPVEEAVRPLPDIPVVTAEVPQVTAANPPRAPRKKTNTIAPFPVADPELVRQSEGR